MSKKEYVSVVVTTFNEEEMIVQLLENLSLQTVEPNEVVIVDGGSGDRTVERIKQWQKENKLKVRVMVKEGAIPSEGRNIGVQKAKNQIIVVTDAGCEPKKDWLEKIIQPIIKGQADSVAGYYWPRTETVFQKCVAPFMCVMPDKLDLRTFLPSSRSIAFTKEAWKEAGKYPEDLYACEDLVFARNLKDKTELIIEPEAIVFWRQEKNLVRFFKKIVRYSQGDIKARYQPHLIKIGTVFGRYLLFLIFPPLFLLYLLFPIIKHFRYVKHPLAIFYLPLLQLTADLGVIYGVVKSQTSSGL